MPSPTPSWGQVSLLNTTCLTLYTSPLEERQEAFLRPGFALGHQQSLLGPIWGGMAAVTALESSRLPGAGGTPALVPPQSEQELRVLPGVSRHIQQNMLTLHTSSILNFRSNLSL